MLDRLASLRTRLGFLPWKVASGGNPYGYIEAELLAALAQTGCPICRITAQSSRNYFFEFINESHREPHVLAELTHALGFCLRHGEALLAAQQGEGTVELVHEILAHRLRKTLWEALTAKSARDDPATAIATPGDCPACRSQHDDVERTASFLKGLLKQKTAAERYGQPGLLCLPHLRILAPRLANFTLERLLSIHEATMAARRRTLDNETVPDPVLQLAIGHEEPNPLMQAGEWLPCSDRRQPVKDLMRLLRGDACPICLEIRRAWLEWVDWLDAAALKDAAIDDLLPTCPEHVWAVVRRGGPPLALKAASYVLTLGLTQIQLTMKTLVPPPALPQKHPLDFLKNVLLGPSSQFRAARRVLGYASVCPVCRRLDIAKDRTLQLLLILLEEPGQRAAFEKGYGLCLKHFARALRFDPLPKVRTTLIEVEATKLGRLQWALQETLRQRAWHARPEAKDGNENIPQQAIRRFSGSMDWS